MTLSEFDLYLEDQKDFAEIRDLEKMRNDYFAYFAQTSLNQDKKISIGYDKSMEIERLAKKVHRYDSASYFFYRFGFKIITMSEKYFIFHNIRLPAPGIGFLLIEDGGYVLHYISYVDLLTDLKLPELYKDIENEQNSS